MLDIYPNKTATAHRHTRGYRNPIWRPRTGPSHPL